MFVGKHFLSFLSNQLTSIDNFDLENFIKISYIYRLAE